MIFYDESYIYILGTDVEYGCRGYIKEYYKYEKLHHYIPKRLGGLGIDFNEFYKTFNVSLYFI